MFFGKNAAFKLCRFFLAFAKGGYFKISTQGIHRFGTHPVQSHAFLDGNKRVAAAITEAFLETNGFELTMTNEEIVVLFLEIASSKLNREQVEQRLREKVKPTN